MSWDGRDYEYPKLTHNEKRNTKLTLIEIEQIKNDYQRNTRRIAIG